MRSCIGRITARGDAPNETINAHARASSASSPLGTYAQDRPSKRSARDAAAPLRSDPAIGCVATKCPSPCAAATTGPLTEATSIRLPPNSRLASSVDLADRPRDGPPARRFRREQVAFRGSPRRRSRRLEGIAAIALGIVPDDAAGRRRRARKPIDRRSDPVPTIPNVPPVMRPPDATRSGRSFAASPR